MKKKGMEKELVSVIAHSRAQNCIEEYTMYPSIYVLHIVINIHTIMHYHHRSLN